MTTPPEPSRPDTAEPRTRRRMPRMQEPLFDDQPFGDLSEAAREAVRHPADPRIDTHLASLGLADDEHAAVAPRATRARHAPAPDLTPQVEELRASVAALREALDRSERRVALLTWAVAALAVLAVAAVAIALAVR